MSIWDDFFAVVPYAPLPMGAQSMKPDKWKATVVLSSDHAGINRALGSLEAGLLRILCRIEDPRKVRDFLADIKQEMIAWCYENDIDMRGWMDNSRYRKK